MRPLLERIVEKARQPEAGASSMLMPLLAPLYAPASGFPEPRVPEQREPWQAERRDEVAVAMENSERPAAIVTRQSAANGFDEEIAQRPMAEHSDAHDLPLPRAARRPIPQRTLPLRDEPSQSAQTLPAEPQTAPAVLRTSMDRRPAGRDDVLPTVKPSAEPTVPQPSVRLGRMAPLAEAPRSVPFERIVPFKGIEVKSMPPVPRAEKPALARPRAAASSSEPRVSPAQITVSIGHIEVRAAQAPPAESPRRPEFRPSLSLAEFLNTPGGDRS